MHRKKKAHKKGADMQSEDDYFGSYTGVCTKNEHERPIQDADDL